MKKNILLLILICLLSGSHALIAQNRETRDVGSFTKVDFRLPGKLHLRQGPNKVEIEASKETLSKIRTKVEGSKLVLETEGKWGWDWKGDDDIEVYVSVPKLEGVYASGSGDIIGESSFKTDDVDLKVSGSGSLKIEVTANGNMEADVSGSGELTVKGSCKNFDSNVSGSGRVSMQMTVADRSDFGISGSGKIQAQGRTDDVDINISGSGKVLAADFETNRCEVRISGSGNVEINVNEELDSHISGSGNVSYRGNPSKINNNASGSGSIRKL